MGTVGWTNGGGGGGGGKSGLVEGSPRWMVSVRAFLVGTVTEASIRIGWTTLRGGGTGGVNGSTSNEPGRKVRAALSCCLERAGAASFWVSVIAGPTLVGDSG